MLKEHRDKIKFGVVPDTRAIGDRQEDRFYEIGITKPHVWTTIPISEWPTYSIKDQDGSSSCGSQGPSKVIEAQTGVPVTAQPLYSARTNKPSEGMSLNDIINVPCSGGTNRYELFPSNGLDEQQMDAPITIPVPIKASSPVFLDITNIDQLAAAIDEYKGIVLTINVAWNEWDTEQGVPVSEGGSVIAGGHCMAGLIATMWNGQKAIAAQNSWGNDTDSINQSSWVIFTEDFLTNRGTGAGAFLPPQIMETQTNQILNKLCMAIQEYEGWEPGSRSFRNENPGNIDFEHQEFAVLETIPKGYNEKPVFACFDTYAHGYGALYDLWERICSGKVQEYTSSMTLETAMQVYNGEGQNSIDYAAFIATKLGVPVDTQISTFVV